MAGDHNAGSLEVAADTIAGQFPMPLRGALNNENPRNRNMKDRKMQRSLFFPFFCPSSFLFFASS